MSGALTIELDFMWNENTMHDLTKRAVTEIVDTELIVKPAEALMAKETGCLYML